MHSLWIHKFATLTALLFCVSGVVNALEEQVSGATSPKPIEKRGFSILPPKGDKWVLTYESKKVIAFRKADSDSHTWAAVARWARLPKRKIFASPQAFLHWRRNIADEDPPGPRFRILHYEAVLDDRFGAYCVRTQSREEDYGAPNAPPGKFLTAEGIFYYILHPESPRMMIVLLVSQRGLADELNPTLAVTAESFFDGFRLKALSKKK